jgi:predicted chitinase
MDVASTPDATAAIAQSRFGRAVKPGTLKRGRARIDEDFQIGRRVAEAAAFTAYERLHGEPVYRPLRIYALDPSASALDGALSIVNVPYEPVTIGARGPQGSILEIINDTAANEQPLDFNDQFLLMQQGRLQSPEDPRFRQQMVYAVCSTTYAAFHQALGRDIAWGFRHAGVGPDAARLRIRPSVADLENAFYDRSRGELCFGSFMASPEVAGRNVPGGRISLCLSHDVVVHEMSHALLDGLRSHFLFPSNLDVLAFHEAFADIIAIFQRFTYRDVVLAAMRACRGELSSATLLTNIAVQFAQATIATGSLRSAVGGTEHRYDNTSEPHQRGEVLVAAVFKAFRTLFARKTAALIRLATNGTGVLPPGQIPDLLASQLTDKACNLASQFLTICIRAIDYCPPIDITFGEFLRAVITADRDLVPHDEFAYREAWIDAFAESHIYPANVPALSESALLWRGPQSRLPPEPQLSFANLQFEGDPGRPASPGELRRQAVALGQLAADPQYLAEFGLACPDDPELGEDQLSLPVVESIRSSRRVGPSGQVVFDLVGEITQRRVVQSRDDSPGFEFFGGATVILDPKGNVRFVIRKSVLDSARLRRQREFVKGDGRVYFGKGPNGLQLPEANLLLRLHEVTRPQSQIGATVRSLLNESAAGPQTGRAQFFLRAGSTGPGVLLLKACLKQILTPQPSFDDSATFDAQTTTAVSRFQSFSRVIVDGIVGPQTWTAIGRALAYHTGGLPLAQVPEWILGLVSNDPRNVRMSDVDVERMCELYEASYGTMSDSQQSGFTRLVQSLKNDGAVTDVRWAAYMLATVKHECAETWRPIEELGKGAKRKYGEPEPVTDDKGVTRDNRYYGRGYVQLTWKENYHALGVALGMGERLMYEPDLALDPDVAYRILSFGMTHGAFTGVRLSKYIDSDGADYRNARRIINGVDQADRIAGYANQLETALLGSLRVAAS